MVHAKLPERLAAENCACQHALPAVGAYAIRQARTPAPARRPLASFLLLGNARANGPGLLMLIQGGLDPAVGALDVRDAELVDVAVEGIGDAAHVPSDASR
jgi:hypothetical protein